MDGVAIFNDHLQKYGDLIKSIIYDKFSAIICPVKKSYNTYETFCKVKHNEMWTPKDVPIYSDVFLNTSEAKRFFAGIIKEKGKVAILEEAVWIGRSAKRVVESVKKLGVNAEDIEIFALARFADYENVRGAEALTYEEIDDFADRILTLCYENSVPYTHCLPKTRVIKAESNQVARSYYNMLKTGGSLGFKEEFPSKFQEIESGYFIRNITDAELKANLGLCLSKVIDYAYLEAYFFAQRNEFVFVPRVCLRPLKQNNLDVIWNLIFELFHKNCDDLFNNIETYISVENAFTKYAILEYIIALKLNYIFVYTKGIKYKVDSDHLVRHYGNVCSAALSPIVDYEWDKVDFCSISSEIADSELPILPITVINKEDAETLPMLFFKDIVEERVNICKLIPDGDSKRLDLSELLNTGEYTINDLITAYGRDHLENEYPKLLVDGKVTSRMRYDEDTGVICEITHVGECAVSESEIFLPIYYSINLVMTSTPGYLGDSNDAQAMRMRLYNFVAEALDKKGYPVFKRYIGQYKSAAEDATLFQKVTLLDTFRKNMIKKTNKYGIYAYEPEDMYDDIIFEAIKEKDACLTETASY